MYPSPRGGSLEEAVAYVRARGGARRKTTQQMLATQSTCVLQAPFCLLFHLPPRSEKPETFQGGQQQPLVGAQHTLHMAPTFTSDPEGPVEDLPELPAEIWAIIWRLVAKQSGFVGARRLMGRHTCGHDGA